VYRRFVWRRFVEETFCRGGVLSRRRFVEETFCRGDVLYVRLVDSTLIYITVVKFRKTVCPRPPQFLLHRRATLSTNSKGTQSVCIAERTTLMH
jgi:hypothetical protein